MRSSLSIVSSVVLLFFLSSPSTIFSRVVSIVIDAINTVIWRRSWPHISQECNGIKPPFFRHFNTSRAIAFKFRIFRIVTATLGPRPNMIFCGFRKTMNGFWDFSFVERQASTALSIPSSQTFSTNMAYGATIAKTFDLRMCVIFFWKRYDDESRKSISNFNILLHNREGLTLA